MAGILQTISVRFIANVAQFSKGLASMQKNSATWAKNFKKTIGPSAKAFADVGAAALKAGAIIGGAFAAGIAAAVVKISALVDEANQIGVGLQQWQSFAYIAETTGTSAEKMAAGFHEMQKSVGEAAGGSSEALAAFSTLGIKFEEFEKLSPDQQFKTLSEALSQVEDKTLRTTLGTTLLGKSYKELGPVMTMGITKMQEMQLEAAKMGQALSDVDLKNVKDMGENFEKAKNMVMGLFNIIAANLAPVFNSLFENFAKVATSGDNFSNVAQIIQDVLVTAIYMVIKAIDYLRANVKGGEAVLLYLTGGFFAMAEGAVKAINFLLSYVEKGFNQLIDSWNKLSALWGGDQVGKISIQFTETAQYLEDMRKGILADAGKVMDEAGNIAGNGWAESFLKVVGEKMPTVGETVGRATAQIVKASEAAIKAAAGAGVTTGGTNTNTTDDLEERKGMLDNMRESVDGLRSSFGDFFTDTIKGTNSLKENFGALIGKIADMAIQLFVVEPLLNGIFGAKGTGAGGGGGWFGAIAGMFGSSAAGGFIPSGVPRYVHKNEMVLPAADSYVVNSRKVNDMAVGTGGGVSQVFNITSNDPASVRREVNKMRPMLRQDSLVGFSAAQSRRKIS